MEEEHEALGQFIEGLSLDGIITVGALAQHIPCKNGGRHFQCAETAEAAVILQNNLSAGDHVLLKASRGEQLEKVLSYFKEK